MTESEAATAWTRERTPTWPALLADVRKRPGMWTGGRTVRDLHLFCDGLRYADTFQGIPAARRLGGFDFGAFEAWVDERFNVERLSFNSFRLAAELAGSDADGFDRWFER